MNGYSRKFQNGVVLILMFLALFLVSSTVILAAFNNRSGRVQVDITVRQNLEIVKEELLGYAMEAQDSAGPGRLPCPDMNNDQTEVCGEQTPGRLPSLGFLSNPDAGLGQGFWYAVSTEFQDETVEVNSISTSTLTFDGQTDVVAVVIAPGNVVADQERPDDAADEYLEGGNVAGPDFESADILDPDNSNDVVVAITRDEVMSLALLRVAQRMKQEMDADLPYPADPTEFTAEASGWTGWLAVNAWGSAVETYSIDGVTATIKFHNCEIDFSFSSSTTIERNSYSCEESP